MRCAGFLIIFCITFAVQTEATTGKTLVIRTVATAGMARSVHVHSHILSWHETEYIRIL